MSRLLHVHTAANTVRIAGYFRDVLVFVIFMVSLQVRKNSTHEFSTHVIGARNRHDN